jgi:phospholipid/cholesterol/gamma-HCH transport system substrate-binding protein
MKKARNEMMVGLFVIVAFVMMSLMVFFISGVYLFRSGYTLNVMYDYVDILDKGAPVRMAGVRIGEVSLVSLVFDEKNKQTRVRMKLFISEGVKVRENYIFEIRGTHILSEPHIEVTPVAGDAAVLEDGAELEGEKLYPIEDLIERAQEITKELKGTSAALNKVATHVSEGEGTAGSLLMRDEMYQDMNAFVKDIKAHPWKLLKKSGSNSGSKRKWYFLWLF